MMHERYKIHHMRVLATKADGDAVYFLFEGGMAIKCIVQEVSISQELHRVDSLYAESFDIGGHISGKVELAIVGFAHAKFGMDDPNKQPAITAPVIALEDRTKKGDK